MVEFGSRNYLSTRELCAHPEYEDLIIDLMMDSLDGLLNISWDMQYDAPCRLTEYFAYGETWEK